MKAAGGIVIAEPYGFEGDGACDRDLRRPGRQLLPAREPDGDVAPEVSSPVDSRLRVGSIVIRVNDLPRQTAFWSAALRLRGARG